MNLEAGGWQRRFMGERPRVEEAVALYKSMGYEVRLEPPGPEDLRPQCGHCRIVLDLCKVVYTRKAL